MNLASILHTGGRGVLTHAPSLALTSLNTYWAARYRLPSTAHAELRENLAAAFHELSPYALSRFTRQCLCNMRADEVRQYRLQLLPRQRLVGEIARIELRGAGHLTRAYAEDRPVIFVTAHYGSFMLAALKAAFEFPDRRLNFFYNPPARNAYSTTSDALLNLADKSCGILHNTPQGVLRALRCLRRGESLCIVADQLTPEGEVVFVPFFGRFYGAMQGVAFFARRAGAQILPTFGRTLADGRTVLEFHEPIDPRLLESSWEDEWLYRITCQIFEAFERQFRLAPAHWRYWRSFLRASLASPQPPTSGHDTQRQIAAVRQLIAHDRPLRNHPTIWSTTTAALNPGDTPLSK